MKRRDFLRAIGYGAAVSMGPSGQLSAETSPATILYGDRTTVVAGARYLRSSNGSAGALWVPKRDLPRINQFEIKPQGACRADICIPIAKGMQRGASFNLTAFAEKVGQKYVAEPGLGVWSFGEIQPLRGAYLTSREAPAIEVPDRRGRTVQLADFRGKKVLLLTWASW